jgi:hypothetical protein
VRARNIKPGFWKNEYLVELPYEYRLLFIGLWMLADRDGLLEDRPKKIKMELFPADNVEVTEGLDLLEEMGMIERYSAEGVKVIFITGFSKHQNPHHTEKKSELPPKEREFHGDEAEVSGDDSVDPETPNDNSQLDNGELTVNPPLDNGEYPADSLIPDSLIPDSTENPDSDEPDGSPPAPVAAQPAVIAIPTNKFNTAREEYPVTEDQIREWAQTYPAVDVLQTLRQIRSWNLNNGAKRKTYRGMAAHIDKWLAREQNRGGNHAATGNQQHRGNGQTWAERRADLTDAITNPDRALDF